ncbi:MAG: UDP-N-acetylglucosamine 2-epimerase (hydrolyzing) [Sphingobacteriales bacterium 17-39-43]|uniref:UDP-N-acetylglucosamine 2-epimerase n=1 Tax=Daejeonella sp. TaxID=2805397 RepID=UPI000BD15079|nr:UDP-N-acetylglucosamine 2-epimerase [Daejeonella sp.]OYZ30201.1 MAG: UDP-N-acetylglucosamine 2-epimerase (hydrolyzing) [Sphingobacteriales bacterium 16-39-50]OZA22944.1 MAG: UDP-N-acetylglucosamine 2-epimerase (hydrolyzing) [Sphingobacteriales bacterium 17-39-43]HQT24162.1 UDP-N-acetylglucosamine 2-epimerase [Daejeonella sp.]HQT58772.1 UDP-N-acetylglucosamine 2-epimerase [Daejeonella sp.]
MRKICVVTGSRAEFGLMYWVMKGLQADPDIKLQICVTGMHLSPDFGLTYKDIESAGFVIDEKVEMLLSSDTSIGISKSIGLAVISMSEVFERLKPDILFILGDRFEIFSVAIAAMVAKIPIAHCHGGEVTEGVIDEAIRHSITKMSHLHFTSTAKYAKRVIQLGESPDYVYNVGALGIENINKLKLLARNQFEDSIGFKLPERVVLVTFHPVTLENATSEEQFISLLTAMDHFKDIGIIFTKPNADTDGRIIANLIDKYVSQNQKRCVSFISLGQIRYLSSLKYVDMVIGNSSSGLIEVPSFKIPTINIGDRQKGRICAASVINCSPNTSSIIEAINIAYSDSFRKKIKKSSNPYGKYNSSDKIIAVLKTVNLNSILMKSFKDI